MSTSEPFKRMVRLAARAFYDDVPVKGDNQPKNGRGDNSGMAVVVLDALTRRSWIREEDLAKQLKLHTKQLRRILRFFEEEKLIAREYRKESAKGAKIHNAAGAAAAGDGQQVVRDGEDKKEKMHTHSYCCLDYAQIYDVVRYRMHRMKKKLKDELDSRNTIQQYICPNCKRRYSALDALQLVSLTDEYFHCENCNGELIAESDKLGGDEMGDGDDNARKRRREKLKDMLQQMEEQLKPLVAQIARIKDLEPPELLSLKAWERANLVRYPNGDPIAPDSNRPLQASTGTPMPFLGDTKVEVAFSEVKGEDTENDTKAPTMKVLPPWMIKQGMNITKEQRGDTSQVSDIQQSTGTTDEKKQEDSKEDKMSLQDEYIKAYYEAIAKRQKEQEEAAKGMPEEILTSTTVSGAPIRRPVGMKSKREDDDNDDVEWEEDQPADTGNTWETYKLADLNVEAHESGDDEEDDIDWEEG